MYDISTYPRSGSIKYTTWRVSSNPVTTRQCGMTALAVTRSCNTMSGNCRDTAARTDAKDPPVNNRALNPTLGANLTIASAFMYDRSDARVRALTSGRALST